MSELNEYTTTLMAFLTRANLIFCSIKLGLHRKPSLSQSGMPVHYKLTPLPPPLLFYHQVSLTVLSTYLYSQAKGGGGGCCEGRVSHLRIKLDDLARS